MSLKTETAQDNLSDREEKIITNLGRLHRTFADEVDQPVFLDRLTTEDFGVSEELHDLVRETRALGINTVSPDSQIRRASAHIVCMLD